MPMLRNICVSAEILRILIVDPEATAVYAFQFDWLKERKQIVHKIRLEVEQEILEEQQQLAFINGLAIRAEQGGHAPPPQAPAPPLRLDELFLPVGCGRRRH